MNLEKVKEVLVPYLEENNFKLYDVEYVKEGQNYYLRVYIDNEKEEYPLINFRNITYFPMTWRFAYEELNFDIEWSEKEYSFPSGHTKVAMTAITAMFLFFNKKRIPHIFAIFPYK